MAGNYSDVFDYINKLFSGENLANELNQDKYKMASGLYKDAIGDNIDQFMMRDWQSGGYDKRMTFEEFKTSHAGFLKVVAKMKDGVQDMQVTEEVKQSKVINLSQYDNIENALMPAKEVEDKIDAGFKFMPAEGKWFKKTKAGEELPPGKAEDMLVEGDLVEYKLRTKKELNNQYKDWTKFINETEEVPELRQLLNSMVDIKGTPDMKRVFREVVDDKGEIQTTMDKVQGRQTDQQLMILIEKANNKIRETDARRGLSAKAITRLRTVKRDAVDTFDYKEASKAFGKSVVDSRINEFQGKYPTTGLYEAQREIIDRMQSEERIKHIGVKPATPFDIAWAKWVSEYRYLRDDPSSTDQSLENLKDMKKYASYGGYFKTYKRAGLDREEGKLARQELNKKISYLEGLALQRKKEIKEYERRRKKGETSTPPQPSPEPVIREEPSAIETEAKELSDSEKASLAYQEEFEKRRREE